VKSAIADHQTTPKTRTHNIIYFLFCNGSLASDERSTARPHACCLEKAACGIIMTPLPSRRPFSKKTPKNGNNHKHHQRRFAIGWPAVLVVVYVVSLLTYTSKLQVNTSGIMEDGGGIASNVDFSLLPLLISPGGGRSMSSAVNRGAEPQQRLLTNDWDKDRDYWIQHIRQRQQYVRAILERVPMDVQNKSFRGVDEPSQCRARTKFYGKDMSILNNFAQNETTKHAIVIPFRDRDYHLQNFEKYMSSYLQHHYANTNHTFKLYIIDQDDNEPFQRGFLMNAALDHVDHDVSCITMHDVDLVPIFFSPVPYHTCNRPTRLINKMQTYDWKIPYDHYFGGIVNLHQQHWAIINGMGNQFRGWGAEDDELYQRLVYRALVNCSNGNPATPVNRDHGNFMAISQDAEHHHARVYGRDYKWNCQLMDRHKWAGISNSIIDGWSLNRYEVTAHDVRITRDNSVLKGFAEIHRIQVVNRIQRLTQKQMRPAAGVRTQRKIPPRNQLNSNATTTQQQQVRPPPPSVRAGMDKNLPPQNQGVWNENNTQVKMLPPARAAMDKKLPPQNSPSNQTTTQQRRLPPPRVTIDRKNPRNPNATLAAVAAQ
jgi:N-terminal domain of galactosyltransferase/N-terminal region of glycosyl transferase group 7